MRPGGPGNNNNNNKMKANISSANKIMKNEAIRAKVVRVVYVDPVTGDSVNEVMDIKDAIALARDAGQDLVQVQGKQDPPVCRVQDFGKMLMEKKRKERDLRVKNKAMVIKEMVVGAGIDVGDLTMKMNKVKDFLNDGHAVKIRVLAKKKDIQKNQDVTSLTTLKVLDALEGHVGAIQQPAAQQHSNQQIFTCNPIAKQQD